MGKPELKTYKIIATVTATVEETWIIEAPSEEAARSAIEDSSWDDNVRTIEQTDRTIGNEEDRSIESVEEIDAA